MKLNSTQSAIRVLIFSLFLLCFAQQGFGQTIGINYVPSQPAGALTWNSAATALATLNGADDVLASFTPPATWGGFYYGGVWYPQATTTFYVSSNGWMSVAKPGDPIPPSSLPVNDLAGNPYRIIAPLWDDLKLHATGGGVTWKVTGTPTTRVLIVEWRGVYWDKTGADTAISFQVRIYDHQQTIAANRDGIEFRYKRNGTSTYGLSVTPSASIGLSGFCANDIEAWTNASGATISKTVPEAIVATKPSDPASYRFTPVAHPNDDCAAPYAMVFNPGLPLISSLGTLLHSTLSAALPTPGCGATATNFSDVWFSFTKPANITNFELFTDSLDCRGVNYTTGIEVFTACGTALAGGCNFGAAGPAGTNASSYLNLTNLPCASTPYLVRVFSSDTLYRSYFRFNIRPPGRTCAYSNDITGCGLPYNSPPLSALNFTNDYDSLYPACHSRVEHGEDYVFSYTPAATQCVNFQLVNTPANSNPGLFIYANGCPSPNAGPTGSEVCYGSVTSAGGAPLSFNSVTLTAGQTYYFVVDNDSSGANPSLPLFNLNITISGSGTPLNDPCSGATSFPVTVAANCVGGTAGDNSCATPSAAGTVPVPGCGSFTDGITPDVWFTFTSLSIQPHQINVNPAGGTPAQDLAMQIYTGGCGGLVLLAGACDDNSNGLMPSLSIVPTGVGVVYYVRIWSNNGTKPGQFTICAVQGCTPTNDLCSGVITLNVGQPLQGDNGCSTGTAEPFSGVSAGCWTNTGGAGQIQTVWYNFIAINAQMRIRLRLLTMFDSQMALYSSTGAGANTCAGTFAQIFCNDNGPNTCGAGGTIRWSEITATGLTVGNTYFLRVDGVNANTGTFELTLEDGVNPYPPINTQDCALAQSICGNAGFTVADPGFQGTGNICDMANNGGTTCMASGERGSAWYTWSVTGAAGTGTDMNFLISPNSPNDYDFILYLVDTTSMMNGNPGGDGVPAVANYCNSLSTSAAFPAVSCNWSACGNTGCNASAGTLTITGTAGSYYQGGGGAPCLAPAIHLPPGVTGTFLLQTSNYTTSTAGFSINWQGTPINGNPPSMIWQGSTTTWGTLANWSPTCGQVPDCVTNGIPAFIGTGGSQMPNIIASTTVKDLTINAGATLTITGAATVLSICGNFTNNGTLTCNPLSTITFIGNLNQSISGIFAAASNQFYNLTVNKGANTLTFNTNIYCQGNFTVTGPNGIVNINSKNLEVGGNFYNYNGNTSLTGLANSTIAFTRRSAVNETYQNDGANLTLNNVSMRTLIAGTLTLNANATSDLIIGANGVLSLGTGGFGQNGVIVTPVGTAREVNVLNSAAAACNAGCASSYVQGKLRRAIPNGAASLASFDFPVGEATKLYQRANITYTAATTGAYNLLAQFKTWGGANCAGPPGAGPVASECVTATYSALPYFDHGYWNIDASIGAPTGTYTATLYNNTVGNNTGMGWTVVKATSGSCAFALSGACFVGSTAGATRRDALNGFSDFATVQSQTPLPIELLSFDASPLNVGVHCKWVTATEINNDHFDIERSKDAYTFKAIGQVKGFGSGVSTQNLSYSFDDNELCTGTLYYRLKQTDINGTFTYSDVVAVNCKNSLVNLAPNPARTNINLNFFEPQTGMVTVEVSDMIGQIVIRQSYNVEKGFNDQNVDIASLPNGVYYLKILNRDNQPDEVARQIKFLKY